MPKKKLLKIKIDKQYTDYSNVKPPERPAAESMIENLHNAGKNVSD